MEIESIHKYIALNKLANGTIEVMFSGQPCLSVSTNTLTYVGMKENTENWNWKINPVFAKLVYGANVMEDIPTCSTMAETSEESIADGLVKLHELGAFNTEVDFPEDTYAATMNSVLEDIQNYAIKNAKNLMEAHELVQKLTKEKIIEAREGRSEFTANAALSNAKSMAPVAKKFYLKDSSGNRVSPGHDSESDALKTFKGMSSTRGIKIMREELEGDVDITHALIESVDDDYDAWRKSCKAAHPDKKILFKSYSDDKQSTVSAEEDGVDKSHGVWDHKTNTGKVFKLDEEHLTTKEKSDSEEIASALKKDKKFVSKYGQDSKEEDK